MTTLVLETSTPQGSVALFRPNPHGSGEPELLFSETFQAGRSHSSQLFAVLERALAPGTAPTRVAVGLGPGSYAGVRIAIAAATGLSVATGAGLLGVPSILALDDCDYVALGDARRDSFYFAVVRGGECVTGPLLVSAGDLENRLAWAEAERLPLFTSEPLPRVPQAQLRFPSAERIGRLAMAGKGISARDLLEPIYLREPHITKPTKAGAESNFPIALGIKSEKA